MQQSNLNVHSVSERHACEATCEGDWVIHRCPKCDYELWDNWQTGEIKALNAKANINHSGYYVPSEYQEPFENAN